MKKYVFDSYALIAFFENESAAEKVEGFLKEVLEGKAQGFMTVVNWGEVYYATSRAYDEEAAKRVIQEIENYPLEIIEADRKLTLEAAKLKARYPIAYADCFALALARLKKAELITGAPEFKKAAKEKVKIRWL
ncbi:type II toxin-antitoxin system VapC family toxin [Thermosulfurimonas sp. F29]|uniref:type II toxin-antitoxin system VapC family toxin n=1 Tax=Thermosulfurimonas sp. F29 TaxID=2867247 RepID=UPI001C83A78C|nr:type II toxin-antitoxin system VapC family toxin [Thermosulfurimonas sp. F29]MBX6423121.1 type II toxin-antitoxin system VapC family toxin [Thermosulfurimonas sp. F29]